ncbi:Na+/H+ antiporter NhaC family protein [Clostridium ganghwense]|uniref:Sodium:proton antiporter n=1 Tax=Clostridium ganghwense TaxID=312089 RepID=A0ABT4CJD4_9CLOT|nr:Na+/H+ antiporter NhaC family protein [Clostridium ganghwense]MCY6369157.1 sodium:proton antiporter [Clostridium ganghwense]
MEYGLMSLLPPILAIILAVVTRQVFLSLFVGIFVGELTMKGWAFFPSLNSSLERIIAVFAEGWVTKTVIFSLLVGSIITLVQVSGGVEGFVDYLTEKNKIIKNKKAAQLLAFFIGVVVFIESSITILTSGTVARPLTDKFKVSREKLAYICDSTSAPICSLIPLNAWGATLMGLIAVQVSNGVITGNPTSILLKSIPFNFYSIIAVLAVPAYILTGKDWGPMKKAEERVRTTGKLMRDGAMPVVDIEATEISTKEGVKASAKNMLLPLAVLIGMMPIGLYITGEGSIFNGSGSTSVFWAVTASLVFAAIYYRAQNIMKLDEFMEHVYKGIGSMIPVVIILICSIAIGNVIGDLGTGAYMASLVEGNIHGAYGPALIFLMGSVIAFSTGTSWGTFALMMPIGIQMAVAMDANVYMAVGAVISGAIMGDHCSPISDTTILSSMAAATDHIDHVKTQVPYALANAAVAFVLYLVVGFML